MQPSIGIVIPTFQAAKHLPLCLGPLIQSRLKPRILIIDSSSTDETISIAQAMGVETLTIPQTEFNHGLTREKGRQFLNTTITVMMTQDAYPTSASMLEKLISPLLLGKACVSYARQIPHQGAGFFASFPRQFNYPSEGHIRSIKDVKKYGVYTFFCSNSCAAYLNTALDEIGGFSPVLFGEDTVAVAQLLQRNHRIAYVAEAEVHHSHDYTLKQEFCRHFDIGYARTSYQHLLEKGGKDAKRGFHYLKALLKTLKQKQPHFIPYAFLQTAVKLLGYRCGQASLYAPLWLKKSLSSQKYYWKE
jgi:rhamnosyltransferase